MKDFLAKRLLRSFIVLFLTSMAVSVQPAVAQDGEVIDEIVAVVGEHIVLKSEVDAVVVRFMQQSPVPYNEGMWLEALNQLIDTKVLTIHAERDTNLVITDDQVEQTLNQRIEIMTAQVGGPSQFEELYGKTTREIKSDLRPEVRDQMLAEQFQGQKINGIQVTPSEVREWFSQFPQDSLPVIPAVVRVAHVVKYPEPTQQARDDAIGLITAIRDSIVVGGGSIEDLATTFTDDEGSANNGGRYEASRLGELVPEFAAVASRSPLGEISAVFESPYGYHIMRVNDRRGDIVDFNHVLIQLDKRKVDPASAIEALKVARDSIITHEVPFELIARHHSEEDISSRLGGRVLDPRSGERDLVLGALHFTWQETVSDMEVDDISEPREVELLDGQRAYHIVHLQRRVPQHRVDIETDYERIQALALQDKQQTELAKWLDNLREEVYVEMRGKALSLLALSEELK